MPKQFNSKGIALFLSGYCNIYNLVMEGEIALGDKIKILQKINELANLLVFKK